MASGPKAPPDLSCFAVVRRRALAARWPKALLACLSLVLGGCAAGQTDQDWLGSSNSTTGTVSQAPADSVGSAPTSSEAGPGDTSSSTSSSGASSSAPGTSSSSSGTVSGTSSDQGSSSEGTEDQTEDEEPLPAGKGFACGVKITRVTINQSVEIELSRGAKLLPKAGEQNLIWVGRRSLFRVYMAPESTTPKQVRVILEVKNKNQLWQREGSFELVGESTFISMGSTANFIVPASMMSKDATFRVRVKQAEPCTPGPRDRAMVPRRGSWAIAPRPAPRLDIQFVRVRFADQEQIPARTIEFKTKLRDAIFARYPASRVRFNLWDTLTATAPGNSTDSANPPMDLLTRVGVLKTSLEDSTPTLHFVGLGVMKGDIAGIGVTPPGAKPGMCVVNARGSEDQLIDRIVSLLARLHGIDEKNCAQGSSSVDREKIGRWGFDARSDRLLEPFGNYDISCTKRPDWIHAKSFADFAQRAEAIQKL